MKISATIASGLNRQQSTVQTNDTAKTIDLPVKSSGYGSAVNGGELLLLALATCFCNDIYREAAKKNMTLSSVEVQCDADFGAEGEPGSNFVYHVKVQADQPSEVIEDLIQATDKLVEIHNTLRIGRTVTLIK